jgi:hypothetical protein
LYSLQEQKLPTLSWLSQVERTVKIFYRRSKLLRGSPRKPFEIGEWSH